VKYLTRFLTFIAKKAVVILVVLALVSTAFTCAMNLSNMFILVNDGMAMRANVILGKTDADELPKFFTHEYIASEPAFADSYYWKYDLYGSSYSLKIEKLWAWPWQSTVTCRVRERVILEAYLKVEHQNEQQLATTEKFPADPWHNYVYDVVLRKLSDGSWVIARITPVEELPEATPRPRM